MTTTISDLPYEMLETILKNLSFHDMITNKLVSKKFNEIIREENMIRKKEGDVVKIPNSKIYREINKMLRLVIKEKNSLILLFNSELKGRNYWKEIKMKNNYYKIYYTDTDALIVLFSNKIYYIIQDENSKTNNLLIRKNNIGGGIQNIYLDNDHFLLMIYDSYLISQGAGKLKMYNILYKSEKMIICWREKNEGFCLLITQKKVIRLLEFSQSYDAWNYTNFFDEYIDEYANVDDDKIKKLRDNINSKNYDKNDEYLDYIIGYFDY